MRCPVLSVLLVTLMLPCYSAGTRLEAFDSNSCSKWRISDDFNSDTEALLKEKFPELVELRRRQVEQFIAGTSQQQPDGSYIGIVVGDYVNFRSKTLEEHFNKKIVCAIQYWYEGGQVSNQQIKCLGESERPLAGTIFRPIKRVQNTDLPTYSCVENCETAITRTIYVKGWEEGYNREYAKDYLAFHKKCVPTK